MTRPPIRILSHDDAPRLSDKERRRASKALRSHMDLIAAEPNENVQISTALSVVITLCMAQSDPQRAAAQATEALTRGLAAAIKYRNSQ